MSLQFSNTFGEGKKVEIWSHDGENRQKLGDMAMEQFAPILRLAYPGRELDRESVHAFMLLVTENDRVVGGMLLHAFGDEWTRTTEIATYKEAVLPSEQRRGFGTQMFKTLQMWALSENENNDPDALHISDIRCAVDWDDAIGKAFMAKQEGFEQYAEYNDEYKYAWTNEDCPMPDLRNLCITGRNENDCWDIED